MVSLALNQLGAYYGSKLTVSGVTTEPFAAGEIVAVIGPNAAGKSTLFKRIAGLIGGPGSVDLVSAKGKHAISYMPQDTGANAVLTVYESILLAFSVIKAPRTAQRTLRDARGAEQEPTRNPRGLPEESKRNARGAKRGPKRAPRSTRNQLGWETPRGPL